MSIKAPPIGVIRGELFKIQFNIAKIPDGQGIMLSVDALYSLINLEMILDKTLRFGSAGKLYGQIMSVQQNIARTDQLPVYRWPFGMSCDALYKYISWKTLFSKWVYEAKLYWWKRNDKTVNNTCNKKHLVEP